MMKFARDDNVFGFVHELETGKAAVSQREHHRLTILNTLMMWKECNSDKMSKAIQSKVERYTIEHLYPPEACSDFLDFDFSHCGEYLATVCGTHGKHSLADHVAIWCARKWTKLHILR